MSADIRQRFDDAALVAFVVSGSDWPRGFLGGLTIPDAWMGLRVQPDGRRSFVAGGEAPQLDRDDALLLARNRALTIPLAVSNAKSRDEHLITATVELLLRWRAREADLAALRKLVGERGELTLATLTDAVVAADANGVLGRWVAGQDASALIAGDRRAALLDTLQAGLQRFCFETGATLERVGRVAFSSDTLRRAEALERDTQQRLERIRAKQMVEQAAAEATRQRLGHLSDVLQTLRTAARDEMEHWQDLLPALAPPERGHLLANLWRLTPNEHAARAIVVVGNDTVAWLAPRPPFAIERQITLPAELGPLRSVRWAPELSALLVGAARGVWILSGDDGEIRTQLNTPAELATPQTGFNSAAPLAGGVVATHSQLGVWRWMLAGDRTTAVEQVFTPEPGRTRAVRAATVAADDTVLFSVDQTVYTLGAQDAAPSPLGSGKGTIAHLATAGDAIFAGTTDGALYRLHHSRPDDWELLHRGPHAIEAFAVRQWRDLCEVLVPGPRGGVDALFAEQEITARVLEHAAEVGRVWACDDAVVALGRLRDRLLVATTADEAAPPTEVPLARLLQQSIADAALLTTDRG